MRWRWPWQRGEVEPMEVILPHPIMRRVYGFTSKLELVPVEAGSGSYCGGMQAKAADYPAYRWHGPWWRQEPHLRGGQG